MADRLQWTTSPDGTLIAARVRGSGPPIVLVHGASTDGSSWDDVANALAEDFTCIAMDRRAHGRSWDAASYSIAREFEDVAAVARSVGGPSVVVGHSFGAICALGGAARCKSIALLVLYEPPLPVGAPVHAHVLADFQDLLRLGRVEQAMLLALRDVVRISIKEEALLRASPLWSRMVAQVPTWRREMKAVDSLLDQDVLGDPECETVLLLGTETAAHHRNATLELCRALSRGRVVDLPGLGHMGQNTDPALVADRIAHAASRSGTRGRPAVSPPM